VGDLKNLPQKTFGKGFLKLVSAEGHVLTNLMDTLQAAGVQDGEHLTAVAQQAKVAASDCAFVLCCGGNQPVAWGHPDMGGNSSAVQDQLRNMQQIQSTSGAFASWLTVQWLPGAIQTMAVTAPQFKISPGTYNKFRPLKVHLLRSCLLTCRLG